MRALGGYEVRVPIAMSDHACDAPPPNSPPPNLEQPLGPAGRSVIVEAATAPDDDEEPKAVAHWPLETDDAFADWAFVNVVVELKLKVAAADRDDDAPFTVKAPLPTEVTLPKTLVKGSAPPPNPRPPSPPNGLPERPLGRVHPAADVGVEMDTVRATAGPDEVEEPSTWAQSPTARSDAVAVTVLLNVVDDDQSTVTELPVRAFWTTMDDELTDETDPDARGRPWGAGVLAAAGDVEEVALELHAPSTRAPAPRRAITSLVETGGRALSGERLCIDLCSWSGRPSSQRRSMRCFPTTL